MIMDLRQKGAYIFNDLHMDGRVAHHAFFADVFTSGLELRLDQDIETTLMLHQFRCLRQDQLHGNKGYVHDRHIRHAGNLFMRQIAGVGALQHDDAGIAADLPIQLPVAYVDGVDLSRSVVQKYIGKTAGRRADVHGHRIRYIRLKDPKRLIQLQSAPAYIGVGASLYMQVVAFPHFFRGLQNFDLLAVHLSGHNQRLRLFPAGSQSPLHHGDVDPDLIRHSLVPPGSVR